MNIKDRVIVKLPDIAFSGEISGIRGVEVIVRYDLQFKEILDARRTMEYDPDGCLTVHFTYVTLESAKP